MRELFKSFILYGLTSGLSKFLPLFLIPIYTRCFTPEEYGIIDLIQSMIYIVMIFGVVQLDTSLQRYYYEVDMKNRKRYSSLILIAISLLSLFLYLILFLLSDNISFFLFKSFKFSYSIKIASLIIPLANISSISFIVLRFMKKPILFGILVTIQGVVSAIFTILFVVYYKLGIDGVFYGQALGFLIVDIIQLFLLRKYYVFYWNFKEFKMMLSFALPQFPARIGSTSNAYINRFFMMSFLSASSIGLYSIALKLASIVQLFYGAFLIAWVPFMYETLLKEDHKKQFEKIFKLLCVGVVFLVGFVSLFSNELVLLFTTKEFYDSYYLVGGLSLYFGLFFIKELVDLGPQITKKTIYITYTYIITTFINIVLLYIFIVNWGLNGVVWSLVITNVVFIIICWYFSDKLYPINYSKKIFVLTICSLFGIVIVCYFFVIDIYVKLIIVILFLFCLFLKRKRIISLIKN